MMHQWLFFSTVAKTFAFQTRASRGEFWGFLVIFWLLQLACVAMDVALDWVDQDIPIGPISGIYTAIMSLVLMSVLIRRIHDSDSSAWNLLPMFFPGIGLLIMLRFALISGTPGPNRFGDAP